MKIWVINFQPRTYKVIYQPLRIQKVKLVSAPANILNFSAEAILFMRSANWRCKRQEEYMKIFWRLTRVTVPVPPRLSGVGMKPCSSSLKSFKQSTTTRNILKILQPVNGTLLANLFPIVQFINVKRGGNLPKTLWAPKRTGPTPRQIYLLR